MQKSIRIMNRNKKTIAFRERKRKLRDGELVPFLNIKVKTGILNISLNIKSIKIFQETGKS